MTPKMKPEEALFLFNNMEFAEKYQGKDEYVEMTLVIKRALEKQIATKPHYIEGDYGLPLCPNCHIAIDENEEEGCCSVCGQALDWSDNK